MWARKSRLTPARWATSPASRAVECHWLGSGRAKVASWTSTVESRHVLGPAIDRERRPPPEDDQILHKGRQAVHVIGVGMRRQDGGQLHGLDAEPPQLLDGAAADV